MYTQICIKEEILLSSGWKKTNGSFTKKGYSFYSLSSVDLILSFKEEGIIKRLLNTAGILSMEHMYLS